MSNSIITPFCRKIDPSTGDLLVNSKTHQIDYVGSVNGVVTGTELSYITQTLRKNLKFFFGEWYLNSIYGIKYFENVLVKDPDLKAISSIFKTAILDSYGINEIMSFAMNFDAQRKIFTLNFVVNTILGTVPQEIFLP